MIGNSLCVTLVNLSEHIYSDSDSKTDLWHKRLRHFDLKTLIFMQSTDMGIDLPYITTHSQVCPSCVMGKCHRKPITQFLEQPRLWNCCTLISMGQ